jgi:hypothetical protein
MRLGDGMGRCREFARRPQEESGMSSETLHEDPKTLGSEVIDRHRAIVSLMEELEAVDWYDQRVAAAGDDELRAVLAHNRDEEKEHAAMVLEWLRRSDAKLAEHLRTYLFTEAPVTEIEAVVEGGGAEAAPSSDGTTSDGSLGIGSLRPTKIEQVKK